MQKNFKYRLFICFHNHSNQGVYIYIEFSLKIIEFSNRSCYNVPKQSPKP